jgi:hypothetical protein
MGTKAAVTHPGSPPAREREDADRSARLASVGQAVELLHVLDLALGSIDDTELGRLASEVREGERALEEWARQVEAFRASKHLFEAGILPDPAGHPRNVPDDVVLARLTRALDAPPPLRFFWEALAFMVGFVLSLLVT